MTELVLPNWHGWLRIPSDAPEIWIRYGAITENDELFYEARCDECGIFLHLNFPAEWRFNLASLNSREIGGHRKNHR